jgi:phospholipid/cholesterol/gamma-HCH transport system substrate-binding protein
MNDTKLYDNLNGAAGSLDSLLIDVKKNPKRYISIKLL